MHAKQLKWCIDQLRITKGTNREIKCKNELLQENQQIKEEASEILRYLKHNLFYQAIKLHNKTIISQQYLNMEQVINILKEHQADKHASLTQRGIVLLEKRTGLKEIIEQKRNFVDGVISQEVSEEKFNAIMAKIDEADIQADINQALPVGSTFGDYGEISNVFNENKTHLKHTPGEVLLVDVWATWCGPCQKPMQHNQEMLEKNEASWAGKVRIIAVSVDDQKETIVQRVTTKKWEKIQHLTLEGWDGGHKLIKDFAISGIPFVALVDKFGKINYQGHPSQINLEDRINELIAQEKEGGEVAAPASAPQQQNAPKEQFSSLLTVANFQAHFGSFDHVCVKAETNTTFQKGTSSQKVTLEAFVFKGDNEAIEKLKSLFGDSVKINEIDYVNVPHNENPHCWECNQGLTYPYYWLKWQEGEHFGCRKCVEKPSTVQGHHFAYEKNSVLLIGKWDKISEKNLGKNIQPIDVTQNKGGHQFGCNGCGNGAKLGEARYICLGCRVDPNPRGDRVDLCQGCLQKIAQGSQQIKQQLANENHVDSHPFLRVLYNVKGYYEY